MVIRYHKIYFIDDYQLKLPKLRLGLDNDAIEPDL